MERLKIDFLVETTTQQRVKTRGKPRNASFWSQRKNSQAVNFVHLAVPCFKRPKEKFTSVQLVGDILTTLLSNPTQKQESFYSQPQKHAPIKRGNPSNIPYICSVSFPPHMGYLMITEKKPFPTQPSSSSQATLPMVQGKYPLPNVETLPRISRCPVKHS